ncbi:hypothetical protein [Reticulibacter mediterranei]|nr:hypothetical protein [Reticulibacter mediterranei]
MPHQLVPPSVPGLNGFDLSPLRPLSSFSIRSASMGWGAWSKAEKRR